MKSCGFTKRHYFITLVTLFGLMVPIQAIKVKDLSQSIALVAGEKLDLNKEWIKYSSQKILKKVSSYPFLEHKSHQGLMGTLNTEVKYYNSERSGKLSKWFKNECKKLENFYPKNNSSIRYDEDKVLCVVELKPTEKSKGMIQYMRAKSATQKAKTKASKVYVYTYNFFTPMTNQKSKKVSSWSDMKASVSKLMEANL